MLPVLPKWLTDGKVQDEAKNEMEKFFKFIAPKYGLR